MTLPTGQAIYSTWQGTQADKQKANPDSYWDKELKMLPHCVPTPLEGILIGFLLNLTRITLINKLKFVIEGVLLRDTAGKSFNILPPYDGNHNYM